MKFSLCGVFGYGIIIVMNKVDSLNVLHTVGAIHLIGPDYIFHPAQRTDFPWGLEIPLPAFLRDSSGKRSIPSTKPVLPAGNGYISRFSVNIVTGIIVINTGCRLITTARILMNGKAGGYERDP
jgi:hypothetical protein